MPLALPRTWNEKPRWAPIPFWLLSLLALAAPLFVWFPAQDSFVIPKTVLLHAGTWLLLASALAISTGGALLRFPLNPVNGFLLAFLCWQTLSILWSQSPALARDQVAWTGMLVLFALVAQSILMHRRDRLLALGFCYAVAAAGVAAWAVVADFLAAFAPHVFPIRAILFDWRDAVGTASMGNSGHVADAIVAGFLIVLAMTLSTRRRRFFALGAAVLALMAAALIAAWSVHSNLSLIVAAVLLAILLRDWWEEPTLRRLLKRRLAILGVVWALVVGFYVIDHPANPHGSRVWAAESGETGGIFAQAFSSGRWKVGGSTRLAIWYTTLEIVRENVWLGAGAGNFTYAYPAVQSEIVLNDPELAAYGASWTNAAHNSVLQTWSETGIPGVFLLVALVGGAFLQMEHRRRGEHSAGNRLILATAAAMLAALCVQAQMTFPLELPLSSFLFVTLLGVPIVLPQRGGVRDLLMPVWRDYGPLRLGIMLKNMRAPTEFHVGIDGPVPVRIVAAVLLAGGGLAAAWCSTGPLRSSVLFRPVYEGVRMPGVLESPTKVAALVSQAHRALEANPANVDCRSALTDVLVRTGQYEQALAELPAVQARLNAYEVYLREALSLEQLGRPEQALDAWTEVFRRQPGLAQQFPGRYQAVAGRLEPAPPSSPTGFSLP